MRKVNQTIKDIVKKIEDLQGQSVSLHVSHGRKRIEKLVGKIENIYPSVFVVSIDNHIPNKISCSFSDVLCGDVKVNRIDAKD